MPMHRRVSLGIAHEQIDHERNTDHGGQIIVEPGFMAERLEPQGHRVSCATEDRHCKSIRETNPNGANIGGKQKTLRMVL